MVGLGQWCGRGKQQQGVFHNRALFGNIVGVKARGGLALVGVLLFLIHDDKAKILQRCKHCTARTYDNIGVSLLDHPPLQKALGIVERRVLHGQAAAEGGKEIVLTGVNIGDFGKSTGETFFDLVKALDEVEGIERYRISSIEPNLLTDEIIEYVSRSRRFMPHFHIPLQSGSDEVLKLMRRRYDTALFASKIKKIKEVMPDSFIGVDVIVGTRGETEEYFGQAYEFIKSLDVTQLHVFSYSERPGTQALKIDHVVAPEEKHRRSQQLLELSDEKTRAFYARHIGQTMPVLLERPKPGLPMHGFTPNYIRVEVPHDAALDNQLVSVRLGDFNADGTALLGAME